VSAARRPIPDPTPRETEILELLLAGATQPEIARQLHLSIHTVSHHARWLAHRAHLPTSARLVSSIWARRVAERDATIAEQTARIAELEAAFAQLERRRGGDRRRSSSAPAPDG
jgi:DNA-binding CsgD family transcriptional regulator